MDGTGLIALLLITTFILLVLIIIWLSGVTEATTTTDVPYQVFNTNLCQFLPTCFGQNPATPYARPVFLENSATGTLDVGIIAGAVQLETNQAVIIYGKRPPPALYFGFTPYLYDRIINQMTGERFVFYASLTDTINNFSIPESAENLAVVFTRNKYILDDQTRKYQNEGYYVVQLPIPDVLEPGDRVSMLTRVTYFENELERAAYVSNPGMKAIKVNYNNTPPYIPMCINQTTPIDNGCLNLKPRAAEPTEEELIPEFQAFVEENIAKYEIVQVINFEDYLGGINSGYDCINEMLDCRADNRDAAYKDTKQIVLTQDTMIVTFGVNHALFNKGIYASIDVYNVNNEFGFGNFLAPEECRFYMITIGYGQDSTIIVPSLFTNIVLAERTYVQLPENIAPTYDSIITPIAYLVKVN